MAEYNLKVTAEKVASVTLTTEGGKNVPAQASLYHVTLPGGLTAVMPAADFEANSSPLE